MEALRGALGLGLIVVIAWVIYYGVISIADLLGDRVFGRVRRRR